MRAVTDVQPSMCSGVPHSNEFKMGLVCIELILYRAYPNFIHAEILL